MILTEMNKFVYLYNNKQYNSLVTKLQPQLVLKSAKNKYLQRMQSCTQNLGIMYAIFIISTIKFYIQYCTFSSHGRHSPTQNKHKQITTAQWEALQYFTFHQLLLGYLTKADETGRACSMHGRITKAYQKTVREPDAKTPLGTSTV